MRDRPRVTPHLLTHLGEARRCHHHDMSHRDGAGMRSILGGITLAATPSDPIRKYGVLLVAERLPGAEIADKGSALRGPHGVPPRRAAPFPKPPAGPLRL